MGRTNWPRVDLHCAIGGGWQIRPCPRLADQVQNGWSPSAVHGPGGDRHTETTPDLDPV
jgi:hypothetical protein